MDHEDEVEIFYAGMQMIVHKLLTVTLDTSLDIVGAPNTVQRLKECNARLEVLEEVTNLVDDAMKAMFLSKLHEEETIKVWRKQSKDVVPKIREKYKRRMRDGQ